MTWFNIFKGGAKDEVTMAKLEDWFVKYRPNYIKNHNLPETIRGLGNLMQEQMDWVMEEFYGSAPGAKRKNFGKTINTKAYRELSALKNSIRWLDKEGEDMRYVRPWEWRL